MLSAHLGLVPDWQFNPNPKQNPLINPYVTGKPNPMYQGTGIGPGYTSVGSYGTGAGLGSHFQPAGIGFTMVDWNPLQPNSTSFNGIPKGIRGLRGIGADIETQAKGAGMGLLLGLGAMAFIAFMALKK